MHGGQDHQGRAKSGLTFAARPAPSACGTSSTKTSLGADRAHLHHRVQRGLHLGQALLYDGPAHRNAGGHQGHCRHRPKGWWTCITAWTTPRARACRSPAAWPALCPSRSRPFQFCAQDRRETLREKQKYLLSCVHSRKIKVNYHDSATSVLEGVFAKGDRRLGRVIETAYRNGAFFDTGRNTLTTTAGWPPLPPAALTRTFTITGRSAWTR